MAELLDKPWRAHKEPWTEETKLMLQKEIVTYELTKDTGVPYINVLLVGEISAGKSSFFNSIESAFEGYVSGRANSGLLDESLTTQYRQYFVCDGTAKDANDNHINFRFCDTMGIEGEGGMKPADFAKIMDGHVKDGAELAGKLVPGHHSYIEHPTEKERIHCVVFVISAKTFSIMDEDVKKKLKDIREEADARSLFPLVVLTKIDEIVELDVSDVYRSIKISAKVDEIAAEFGVKKNRIMPVKNYEAEVECDTNVDILTFRALRQILRNSKDFLKDKVQKASRDIETEEYFGKKNRKINNEKQDDLEEMKVIKQTRIIGASGHFLYVGDSVEVLAPKDQDGLVKIKTSEGIIGVVDHKCLEPRFKKWKVVSRQKLHMQGSYITLERDDIVWQIHENDGDWMTVKTENDQQGEIQSRFLVPYLDIHRMI